MEPGDHRADRPRLRRLEARARLTELEYRIRSLRRLTARLRSGDRLTSRDLADAERDTAASQRAAATADLNDRQAHRDAAAAHRATAEGLERAGYADRAAEHRRLAGEDDLGGIPPSSGSS